MRMSVPRLGQHPLGNRLEALYQAEGRHDAQAVPGQVHLPPAEALADRSREEVVVVVPAFAKGKQGQPEVVAAVIAGLEAAAAESMRQRVDGHGGMEQHDGGNEEAPDQQLRSRGVQARRPALQRGAEGIQRRGEQYGNRGVEAIQPTQFREARQVGDARKVRGEGFAGQEPAHVAPPEAMAGGRMQILFIVGVAVMVAMVRGPPQRSALHAGGPDDSEYELHRSRRLEGAMRKIAVVERGDREHAHGIERRRNDHCGP
ncbi:hypothetical protein G6F57_018834 [Rhizopus arrhizus]|nr:hypothetical protein G6F57_018834 [Rhizopus arrhizus]